MIKKRHLLFFLFLCSCLYPRTQLFSQGTAVQLHQNASYNNFSESQLQALILSSFEDGFYPTVLSASPYFRQHYPASAFAGETVIIEAETLYRLGRKKEAEQLVIMAPEKSEKYLLLSVIAYEDGRFEQSIQSAWKGISLHSNEKADSTRAHLMLCAARSLDMTGDFHQAETILSSLFFSQDASYLKADEYVTAAEIYLRACSALKKSEKAVKVYTAAVSLFNTVSVSDAVRSSIRLYGADALLSSGEVKKALEQYEFLMKTAETKTAVAALERSYNFYSDSEKPQLMEKVSSLLAAYPEVLSEFWTRAGAAAYSAGKKEDALAAFVRAAGYGNAEYTKIGAVYRASLMTSISGDYKGAVDLLEKYLDLASPYYSVYLDHLAEYCAHAGLWDDARRYAGLLAKHRSSSPSMIKRAEYWQALSAYAAGDYGAAEQGTRYADTMYGSLLHAQALYKTGSIQDALTLFSSLFSDSSVPYAERRVIQLDTVSAFARAGKYRDAWDRLVRIYPDCASLSESAAKQIEPSVLYLGGLCAAGLGKWENAEILLRSSFAAYKGAAPHTGSYQSLTPVQISASQYFYAYSLYSLGKYEAAYEAFAVYQPDSAHVVFEWNALLYAARAAVQTFYITRKSSPWLVRSVIYAEKAFKTAVSEQQKIDGVLLVSGVYSDAERYDDALAVLVPHINQATPFGMTCLFQYAGISTRMKNLDKASESYELLASRFPQSPLAQESLYRRGEIFYESGMWQRAVENLSSYRRQYPDGAFIEQTLFYMSDSHFRQENNGQSILLSRELLKQFPQSHFEYQTLSNLTVLYKKRGEYDAAYKTASQMLSKYPAQASKEGIEGQITELLLLAGGADHKTASLLSSFERAGGVNTPAGRLAGIELVSMFLHSNARKEEGVELASSILERIPAGSENDTAAQIWFLLGTSERENLQCQDAAESFLKSAALASFTDSDRASHALYCAAESFDCALMYTDAQKTYAVMKEKYAGSLWTIRAAALLQEGDKK